MKILIIICSIIVLGIILKSILDEEKYRKLYKKEKDARKVAENKIDNITDILKENDKIPVYNRNSYRTIRLIKEELK